ncbi:contact-dependent growth inhibition system immunity protein [Pseudomonas sp. GCM10022186]|uniref:contact-dependent growth inhibition system immunity protein n=1 Tax=Pseudomonas sp. GCM10022186 TaxID=3252650 RepID=UPI003615FCA0
MNDVIPRAWANAKLNKEFICIETYSGYRMSQADHKGVTHLLAPDASDQAVGEALLDALSKSRFVLPEPRKDVWIHPEATFDSELYDFDASEQRYKDWISQLMEKYDYKTKRALFKDMKNCSIELKEGSMTIRPSRHEKLEGWGGTGLGGSDYVIIPATSTPEEVGVALRLAFSRCT